MNLDISNLPNDFYWEDLFPVNKYIFSIKWFSYSIWGYCKSPFWIWKIIWIIDWWFDVEIIDWKKENIWEIYKNIDIRYISFIWWVVNKTWNDRNWKKYELSINEEKKELDYTYDDNWTLQDDHDKNHMFFNLELNKENKRSKDHYVDLENLRNMDNRDKQEYFSQWWIFEEYNDNKIKDLKNTLDCAYFYFLIDLGVATYISSYISASPASWKIIEKYTSSRWGLLKKNYSLWTKRKEILVKWNKIIKETSDFNTNKFLSISENINDNLKVEKKDIVKPKWMGDISSLMFVEQDEIMRADYLWTTLITWVAWSWKTNVLLHRIDYLLTEFPDKFLEWRISVFCYNIWLKKYVEKMINSKFPNVKVFSKDKYFYDLSLKFLWQWFNFNNIYIDNNYIIDIYNKIFNYIISLQEEIDKELEKRKIIIIKGIDDGKNKETRSNIKNFDISNPKPANKTKSFKKLFENKSISKIEFDYILYFISSLKITKVLNQYNKYNTCIEINNEYYKNKVLLNTSKTFEYNNINYYIEISKITWLEINWFNHIFIDEVQDLSPIEVKIFNNLHNKGMTIAWDITQVIHNNNFIDFEKYFWIKIDRQFEIKMSHRSSLQTILFANQFINNIDWTLQADSVWFIWDKPNIIISLDKRKRGFKLLKIIEELLITWKNICIIHNKDNAKEVVKFLLRHDVDTYYAEKKSWDFSRKLHVSSYLQIKWLEFDYVILLGSNELLNKNKQQILYTASTRTKEKLYIIEKSLWLYSKFDENTYNLIAL